MVKRPEMYTVYTKFPDVSTECDDFQKFDKYLEQFELKLGIQVEQ